MADPQPQPTHHALRTREGEVLRFSALAGEARLPAGAWQREANGAVVTIARPRPDAPAASTKVVF